MSLVYLDTDRDTYVGMYVHGEIHIHSTCVRVHMYVYGYLPVCVYVWLSFSLSFFLLPFLVSLAYRFLLFLVCLR